VRTAWWRHKLRFLDSVFCNVRI